MGLTHSKQPETNDYTVAYSVVFDDCWTNLDQANMDEELLFSKQLTPCGEETGYYIARSSSLDCNIRIVPIVPLKSARLGDVINDFLFKRRCIRDYRRANL